MNGLVSSRQTDDTMVRTTQQLYALVAMVAIMAFCALSAASHEAPRLRVTLGEPGDSIQGFITLPMDQSDQVIRPFMEQYRREWRDRGHRRAPESLIRYLMRNKAGAPPALLDGLPLGDPDRLQHLGIRGAQDESRSSRSNTPSSFSTRIPSRWSETPSRI